MTDVYMMNNGNPTNQKPYQPSDMEDIAFSVANAALDFTNSFDDGDDTTTHLESSHSASSLNFGDYNLPSPLMTHASASTPHSSSLSSQAPDFSSSSMSTSMNEYAPAPVKLFIGQIPTEFDETQLLPLFVPFGRVLELVVLKDKVSRNSRGCGFVVYDTLDSAERAIAALDNRVTLGALERQLIVRRAANNHRRPAAASDRSVFKLFVGMLSKSSNERRVREIFEAFGPVHEVYLMRNTAGVSKGCAFVKFKDLNHALNAIAHLHESYIDPGSPRPLNVRFANPNRGDGGGGGGGPSMSPDASQFYGRGGGGGGGMGKPPLFYGMGMDTSPIAQVLYEAVSNPGPTLSPKRNNNNGTPTNSNADYSPTHHHHQHQQQQYQQQQQQYHHQHHHHHQQQQQPLQYQYGGAVGAMAYHNSNHNNNNNNNSPDSFSPDPYEMSSPSSIPSSPSNASASTHHHPRLFFQSQMPPSSSSQQHHASADEYMSLSAVPMQSRGPLGANLFLHNIDDLTSDSVRQLFSRFGTVHSANVLVDKMTQQSRGLGFVSFSDAAAAIRASDEMEGYMLGNNRRLHIARRM